MQNLRLNTVEARMRSVDEPVISNSRISDSLLEVSGYQHSTCPGLKDQGLHPLGSRNVSHIKTYKPVQAAAAVGS